MKRTSFSKSVRTIVLMVLLSAIVGTSVQQSAQAQNKAQTQPATACVPLPQGQFFNEFEGLTFSREQDRDFRKIAAEGKKRSQALSKTFREVDSSDGGFIIEENPGTSYIKMQEILKAEAALERDKVPKAQQIRLLTQRYGRYAKFTRAKNLAFTPEQIETGQKIWRDREAQTMAILLPEQQKIYREKLAILRGIEACEKPSPFSPRMGSVYRTVDGKRVSVDGSELSR
jgi:hypothetical protein